MIQFCAHFTVLKLTALAGMEHVPLHIGVKIHVGLYHICLPHAFFAFLRAPLCVHLLQIETDAAKLITPHRLEFQVIFRWVLFSLHDIQKCQSKHLCLSKNIHSVPVVLSFCALFAEYCIIYRTWPRGQSHSKNEQNDCNENAFYLPVP